MKKTNAVRTYYMLPCCLLLLNVVNSVVSYKAEVIANPLWRTLVVMGLVLFGGSVVTFVVAPGLTWLVRQMHHGSKRGAGRVGEAGFLIVLGLLTFLLYFEMTKGGPAAILPAAWVNPA